MFLLDVRIERALPVFRQSQEKVCYLVCVHGGQVPLQAYLYQWKVNVSGSSDREYACLLVAGLAGAPSLLPRHRPGERLVAGVTRGEVRPPEVTFVSRIVSSFNHVQC